MKPQDLIDTARKLMADNKGLVAMDESIPTCDKRFAALGIAPTPENRRSYRELLITTPDLSEFISGAIVCDETIRQTKKDKTPFAKAIQEAGMMVGIKVDRGAQAMAGHPEEKVTEGLDGLRNRLVEYGQMGARFTKWRAVISANAGLPSLGCMEANAHALARFASLCQEADLVPVIEAEVLMEGDHSLEQCRKVTTEILKILFDQLYRQKVLFEGILIKTNMVTPGKDSQWQQAFEEVAKATVNCLLRTVPAAVPGIAFLSGGQSGELASAHLNAMNLLFKNRLPWSLTFSFSRAVQYPALEIWRGNEANNSAAQKAFYHRVLCAHAARLGEYNAGMER